LCFDCANTRYSENSPIKRKMSVIGHFFLEITMYYHSELPPRQLSLRIAPTGWNGSFVASVATVAYQHRPIEPEEYYTPPPPEKKCVAFHGKLPIVTI
jgi:hypothetical protein